MDITRSVAGAPARSSAIPTACIRSAFASHPLWTVTAPSHAATHPERDRPRDEHPGRLRRLPGRARFVAAQPAASTTPSSAST